MQGHKLRGILSVCIKDETGGWWRGQKRREREKGRARRRNLTDVDV